MTRFGRMLHAISLAVATTLVLGLVVSFAVSTAPPAQAAAGNGVDPGSITMERSPDPNDQTQLKVGDSVRINANWAVPNGTVAGYQFSMQLPPQLAGAVFGSFDLMTSTGETAGSCVVSTQGVATCTLSSWVNGKQNVSGSLWFTARATGTTGDSSLPFVVDGGTTVQVDIPGSGGIGEVEGGGGGPTPPTQNLAKGGRWGLVADDPRGYLFWSLSLPSSVAPASGEMLTVRDQIASGDPHLFVPLGEPGREPYFSRNCDSSPGTTPEGIALNSSQFAVAGDQQSLTMTLDSTMFDPPAGSGISGRCAITIFYYSVPTGAATSGQVFRNSATVGDETVYYGISIAGEGGGDAGGNASGTFSLSKIIQGGTNPAVPDGQVFRVTADMGSQGTRDFDVPLNGAAIQAPSLPVGTVVTLSEVTPYPTLPGVDFGTPQYIVNGVVTDGSVTFTIEQGTSLQIQVRNIPTVAENGQFQVTKLVTGDAAGSVPGSTPFQVTYQYTVPGGTPSNGVYTVTPGTPQMSVPYPVGTVITLQEGAFPSVDGVTWGTPAFSVDGGPPSETATFTITDTTTVNVSLANTADPLPPTEGAIEIVKQLSGSSSLVPVGTQFTVNYSYNGGANTGSLTVTAGNSVSLGPLPVGTVVTLSEATPPAIPGAVWQTPTFTPGSTITVGAGTTVLVTLTNPVSPAPSPGFTLAKTSNPLPGTTVQGGDQITYTVTGRNTGDTALPTAQITDDLGQVLNNAVLVGTPSATYSPGGGAPAPTLAGTTLTWNGSLVVGQSVNITYTVRVNDDVADGTILNNHAEGSATPPGEPPIVPPPVETEHPVPGFTLTKTSVPASGTSVRTGDTVVYSVVGTNTGATALPRVVINDDLSNVLNHATVTAGPTSTVGVAPTITGTTLNWTGVLQAGQSVTLSYTVTINATVPDNTVIGNVVTGSAQPPDPSEPINPPPVDTEHPIPGFEFTKEADPPSGSSVQGGDVITYTLTARNTGATVLDPVEITDNMAEVLDKADISTAPVSTLDPQPTLTGTTLSWTGALQIGESVQITYAVRLHDDVAPGSRVHNIAHAEGTPPEGPPIIPEEPETEEFVPGFSLTKTSDPEPGTTVQAGSEVTYSVVGTNTGATALDPVTITDDMSGVLDDATLVGEPESSRGDAPTLSGTTLTWTGSLQIDESVTLTYTVRVNDDVVDGALLNNRVNGSAQPPEGPPIDPPEVVIEHPVPGFTLEKTADPEPGTVLQPGDVITYRVTGTNTGATLLSTVTITDDLSRVLNHATLVEGPTSSMGSPPTVSGTTITWEGPLEVGQAVVLTYSVKLDADAYHVLVENLASAVATPEGGDPIIPEDVRTSHPTGGPGLSSTGLDTTVAAALGALLLAMGAATTISARGRRRRI